MSIDWAAIWTASPWRMIACRMPAAPTPLANSESKAACLRSGRAPPAVPVPFGHGHRVAQPAGLFQVAIGKDRLSGRIDPGQRHPGVPDVLGRQVGDADLLAAAPDLGDLPRLVMVDRKVGDPIAQLAMRSARQARRAGRRRSSGPSGRPRGSPRNMPSRPQGTGPGSPRSRRPRSRCRFECTSRRKGPDGRCGRGVAARRPARRATRRRPPRCSRRPASRHVGRRLRAMRAQQPLAEIDDQDRLHRQLAAEPEEFVVAEVVGDLVAGVARGDRPFARCGRERCRSCRASRCSRRRFRRENARWESASRGSTVWPRAATRACRESGPLRGRSRRPNSAAP